MATNYNPAIVSDGLVLCLDAANTKSYPGSGTTWNDISGKGNDGTLTNGPTFDSGNKGTIVFDGSNDYVSETSGLTNSFLQGNWSISFWVNFDVISPDGANNNALDRTLLHHGQNSTRRGLHLINRNGRFHFGLYGDDLQGTQILTTNTWYNVVFTLNNTSYARIIYINGSIDDSDTGNGSYAATQNNARICGRVLSFGSYFDGNMSIVNAYNRVLTATEVLQNYNALKGRFGL